MGWVVNATPGRYAPGKGPVPIEYEAGGFQSCSGRMRKISPPIRIRSPDRLNCNKSLYRLSYPSHKSTSYVLLSSQNIERAVTIDTNR